MTKKLIRLLAHREVEIQERSCRVTYNKTSRSFSSFDCGFGATGPSCSPEQKALAHQAHLQWLEDNEYGITLQAKIQDTPDGRVILTQVLTILESLAGSGDLTYRQTRTEASTRPAQFSQRPLEAHWDDFERIDQANQAIMDATKADLISRGLVYPGVDLDEILRGPHQYDPSWSEVYEVSPAATLEAFTTIEITCLQSSALWVGLVNRGVMVKDGFTYRSLTPPERFLQALTRYQIRVHSRCANRFNPVTRQFDMAESWDGPQAAAALKAHVHDSVGLPALVDAAQVLAKNSEGTFWFNVSTTLPFPVLYFTCLLSSPLYRALQDRSLIIPMGPSAPA